MSSEINHIALITTEGKEILIEFPESIQDEFNKKLELALS